MNKQLVFGLIGKSGAGKTTAAEYLHRNYGIGNLMFAAPLKEAASIFFGDVFEEGNRNTIIEGTNTIKRKVLCDLSDLVKNVDNDVILKIAEKNLRRMSSISAVQFTDVRFPNEVKWLKGKMAVFIEIIRDDAEEVPFKHESEEADFSQLPKITIYNNGTIKELHKALDKAMLHYLEYLD